MKHKTFPLLTIAVAVVLFFSTCKKEKDEAPVTTTPPAPSLIFKFKFDSTQVRLNGVGNPSTIPAGNAAQSPRFNLMSQHYIELAGDFDSVGKGKVLYVGTNTTAGGSNAIDYSLATQTAEGAVFFSKPLSQITPGSYKWLRVSLAYQNYDITYKDTNLTSANDLGIGTVASFIGFNTYVTSYKINGRTYAPSAGAGGPGNHAQGYWGFETTVFGTTVFIDGQSAGTTTVPNPLFATSPIPAGSCLVTGQFVNSAMANSPLVITGNETSDIVITVSLSVNKSFEWSEVNADGYFQPQIGEAVVDMGIRGLIPVKN